MVVYLSAEGKKLQDPARALRLAIRHHDQPKLGRLVTWLLQQVPLQWDEHFRLVKCSIIRGNVGPGDDGFAFDLDQDTGIVREVYRPDEAPELAVGDRVVTLDGQPLRELRLREAVEPESVAELGVWKRKEMAKLRRRIAQPALDDALIEVSMLDGASDDAVDAKIVGMAALLLREGASHKARDAKGMGSMHWACRVGTLGLVRTLIQAGASVNAPSDGGGSEPPASAGAPAAAKTAAAAAAAAAARAVAEPCLRPVQLAVVGGHAEVLHQLLRAKAAADVVTDDGRQLIHLAAMSGRGELVLERLLDECGVEVLSAATGGHGWPPLFVAAAADNEPMVRAMARVGASLQEVRHGRTLLHHAAACGAPRATGFLAAQLALEATDRRGRTATHLAAAHGRPAALRRLLLAGADVLARARDGRTALEMARHDECRLLLNGALKQLRTQRGTLLLQLAAHGDVAGVRQLHAAGGVPLDFVDGRGFSALHHAAAAAHLPLVAYLLAGPHGAALAAATTSQADAQADWLAVDLAPADSEVRQLLVDFGAGGAKRERALERMRPRVPASPPRARSPNRASRAWDAAEETGTEGMA